jgi:broad specificity phosphatase PhoE
MKRWTCTIGIGGFLVCVVYLLWWWSSPATTVILVRHAERLNATDTTSLSVPGRRRADTLAHVVGSAGIQVIYVSNRVRTQQTAAPTAAALGLTPVVLAVQDTNGLVDSIRARSGQVILVVGHSDTLPIIMRKLGVASPPSIASGSFDNLFVVTFWRWRTMLTHLKYGSRS